MMITTTFHCLLMEREREEYGATNHTKVGPQRLKFLLTLYSTT
ncbi:hypothetical protein IHE45_04G020900 [Dioscorea alata]|uniref:Uncharacterized protein n=1 Tax=Dioscorea alata TaxID=55571 RepID=A0ACB7WBJ7_DIOAL|nr:hypothetical protein IHE45_04G020900 [Dioscorea alata]